MEQRSRSFVGNVSDIDIRLLRLFCTVASCGGFAAAESELQTNLSTISKQIKGLEVRLGVRLCRRGRAGFALTDQGHEVYLASRQLLDALDAFRFRINDIHTELVGELNLGIVDTVITDPDFRLPAVLGICKRRAPRVHVNISVDPPNLLEKGLLDETLHAAVVTIRQRVPGLKYKFLYSEQNNLYCSETHPLYARAPEKISPADFSSCELVGRSYADQDEATQLSGELPRSATANDVEGVALMVLTGRYLGYLPDHFVNATKFPAQLRAVLPERYGYAVGIELATRQSSHKSPILQTFLDGLDDEFGVS